MRGKPHSAFPIYTDSVTFDLQFQLNSQQRNKARVGLAQLRDSAMPLALNQRRKGGPGAARPSDAHIERS
jgi:hypothetical protein